MQGQSKLILSNRWELESLRSFCKESKTLAEVLRKLNVPAAGGNFQTLKKKIREYSIDVSHFGYIPLKATVAPKQLCDYRSAYKAKKWFLTLVDYNCVSCGLSSWYNDKPLKLQLDHINGDRFENLRLLCPNCHSQTDTFANKNRFKEQG